MRKLLISFICILVFIIAFTGCGKSQNKIFQQVEKKDSVKKINESFEDKKTESKDLKESLLEFYIGESKVNVLMIKKNGEKNIKFFNMHENEQTSVTAGKDIVENYGGTLISFKTRGNREITFSLSGRSYTVDPNRIFTSTGVQKTLKKYGNYSEDAKEAVNKFVKQLLDSLFIDSNQIIVALHNNTNNNLSIKSYMRGGEYENEAIKTYQDIESDIDDFFFVTDINFFEKLSGKNFNVALQNNANVTDDGSLSVYCGYNKIPYINVEAETGHLSTQIKMLEAVLEILKN
ncbi:MAG TPA: hypothetical protein VIL99_01945 [Ignavibacteria bacterium]